jgi:H+/Cl- antiporter ClcA
MVDVYRAPRVVSWSKGREVVDSEWIIVLGVAALVAAVLGIAVMVVVSVCQFCGTLGSYSACYWTMISWLHGYWC